MVVGKCILNNWVCAGTTHPVFRRLLRARLPGATNTRRKLNYLESVNESAAGGTLVFREASQRLFAKQTVL